jgi:hypothetical protein
MQQKKNIKLLIVWTILLAVTTVAALYQPDSNKLDIDKGHFALKEKVNEIDLVKISSKSSVVSLNKDGRQWVLNDTLTANPTLVNDLLGILSEVSVRRIAAANIQEDLSSGSHNIFQVTLSGNNQELRSFRVVENEKGTLTYFIDDLAYVVNIPGYNYHIADIFKLKSQDWRSPYVFASNWSTLDKMIIQYPNQPEANFDIVYDKSRYTIPSVIKLDTAAMYEYMQQISFLQVQTYHTALDTITSSSDLNVTVQDVGGQQMILDFYIYPDITIGQINNTEWATFDQNQVNSLIRSDTDFNLE